jgi:ABC-2 type transport system ATP-binding protein
MPDAIVLRGLTKAFGDTVAVRAFDLAVPQGALYGVIGPNGAGKTTTIRMILSILLPDRGELAVLGRRSAMEAKDRIGYLPEERGLYKRMRVGQFLAYMAHLKNADGADLRSRIRAWLDRVDLGGVEHKRCEELSKGMQQKVQFLAAVIHRPDLLILDEPFSGLDPVNQRLLRELVEEEHRRGATVLFSTHVMVHAEQLCDHVVMIHRGDKVLDDTIGAIRARYDPRNLLFEPLDSRADVGSLVRIPGVASLRKDGTAWDIALAPGASPAPVIQQVAAAIAPARVELRRPSLEDVFITIVREASAEGDDATLRAAIRDDGDGRRELRS